jgi:hypothetical protein
LRDWAQEVAVENPTSLRQSCNACLKGFCSFGMLHRMPNIDMWSWLSLLQSSRLRHRRASLTQPRWRGESRAISSKAGPSVG